MLKDHKTSKLFFARMEQELLSYLQNMENLLQDCIVVVSPTDNKILVGTPTK